MTGVVAVVNSTLSGNSALGGRGGGGIYNDAEYRGTAVITLANTTISSNSAASAGGAICNYNAWGTAPVTVVSSTLIGNSGSVGGGGGIYNSGNINIGNSILLAGASGSNIKSFYPLTSFGYNLSSDDGGGFLTNVTDQINIDPMLGLLQDNGGPVFTHALLPGSPAIDKGKNLNGDTTDQRGFSRTSDVPAIANAAGGDGTDIGACELFQLNITTV